MTWLTMPSTGSLSHLGWADMLLNEKHARLRAHDDADTVASAHDFVVRFFGGDFQRAAWFMDEVAKRTGIDSERNTFYSIRNGRVKWHTLRSNA